jgi:LemA protein
MEDFTVSLFVFAGLLGAVGLWLAAVYNRLIRLRNRMDALWADIDVQLKRRHDLVPNLVSVVEGYATHERGTLDEVTLARSAAVSAQSLAEQAHAEGVLSGALGRLFAIVEDYPELQAEERFQDLQHELWRLENTIALARSAYNLTVQAYNNAVQTIPTNVVAWLASFEAREYLSAEESDRAVPDATVELPPVPSAR